METEARDNEMTSCSPQTSQQPYQQFKECFHLPQIKQETPDGSVNTHLFLEQLHNNHETEYSCSGERLVTTLLIKQEKRSEDSSGEVDRNAVSGKDETLSITRLKSEPDDRNQHDVVGECVPLGIGDARQRTQPLECPLQGHDAVFEPAVEYKYEVANFPFANAFNLEPSSQFCKLEQEDEVKPHDRNDPIYPFEQQEELMHSFRNRLEQAGAALYQHEPGSTVEAKERRTGPPSGSVVGADDKIHRCLSCSYTSIRKGNLVQHVKSKHNDNLKMYRCAECGYESKWKEAYERHLKSKHDDNAEVYKCAHCDYTTKTMANLLVHVTGKHINASDEHRCPHCDFTTSWRSVLRKHVRRKHDANAQIYSCPHCEHTTKTKYSMTQHVKVLHDEDAEVYHCPACDYSTRNKNGLSEHVRVKHDDTANVYSCAECDYSTKRKLHLLRHASRHGVMVMGARPIKTDAPTTAKRNAARPRRKDRLFKCTECAYEAKQRIDLIRHVARKHAVDVKLYECSECEYTSKVKNDLVKHKKGKHNSEAFQCTECAYSTKWKQRFVQHVKMRHEAQKVASAECPSVGVGTTNQL